MGRTGRGLWGGRGGTGGLERRRCLRPDCGLLLQEAVSSGRRISPSSPLQAPRCASPASPSRLRWRPRGHPPGPPTPGPQVPYPRPCPSSAHLCPLMFHCQLLVLSMSLPLSSQSLLSPLSVNRHPTQLWNQLRPGDVHQTVVGRQAGCPQPLSLSFAFCGDSPHPQLLPIFVPSLGSDSGLALAGS